MPTPHDTVPPDDVRRLIWRRAGSPPRPRNRRDIAAYAATAAAIAEDVREELARLIRQLDDLAEGCDETPICPAPVKGGICGKPLPEPVRGRPPEWCSDPCRKRAHRARAGSVPVSLPPPRESGRTLSA